MRVLVTGGTGFTGGRLVELLREQGRDVVVLARRESDTRRATAAGAIIHEGDVRNADDVTAASRDCSVIYHVAALYRSARHPDRVYRDVNVGGTQNVLRAAELNRVGRVVHCSTAGVHGKVKQLPIDETGPFSPGDIYQETKLEGEELARQAADDGQPVAIVRPAGIYGPGDLRFLKLFASIQQGKFRMIGSGQVVYHFTHVDDICRGMMLCASEEGAVGETFILCGERYHPLREVVDLVGECVGTPVRAGSVPVWPVMAAATVCEAVCKLIRVEPPLYRRRLDFFVKDRAFTCDKARRVIGYSPRISLEEGFHETARWYAANGHLSSVPAPSATARS